MQRASTATVAVLFCDVVGSTERLTRIGDEAADELRRRLFSALRVCVHESGGLEVKNLGDGLMVVFERSTVDSLACAVAMHRAAAGVDESDPVAMRIGISVGEVSREDDDWFGTPVVEAARLCSAASTHETLAAAVIQTLVGSRGQRYTFGAVETRELKGLAAPLPVVSVAENDDFVAPPAAVVTTSTTSTAASSGGSPESSNTSSPGSPDVDSPRSSPRRWRWSVAAAGVVAAVAVLAWQLGSTDPEDRPESALRTEARSKPLAYEPTIEDVACDPTVLAAVPEAICQELRVPAVRSEPNGERLRLLVIKAAARTPSSRPPVVLLDPNELLAVTSLRDSADVYLLSIRGFVPGDEIPQCPELAQAWRSTLTLPVGEPAAISSRVEGAEACATRLRSEGAKLEALSLAEVADDLRDLVVAEGLDKVSVASGAFTTVSTVRFANANPGMVESLLFTNPTPPGESALADPTATLAKNFEALAAACAADPVCQAASPDLADRYRARFQQFADQPVLVSTPPLAGGAPIDVLLDGKRLTAALETVMQVTARLGQVPGAILTASNELTAASAINDEVNLFTSDDSPVVAALSFGCGYDVRLNRVGELSDSTLPAFAGANEPTFREICEVWGVPPVFDLVSQPLTAPVPVFVAEGGFSVAGVNGWGAKLTSMVADATVMRFATMSEDVIFVAPPCLREARAAFVADPKSDFDVAACEAQSPPLNFGS